MRSRWVGRWFGQGDGGGFAPDKRRANGQVMDGAGKGRQAQGPQVIRAKSSRICLGIGDGSVHRQ